MGSVGAVTVVRPLAKSRNSFTNAEMRLTLSSSMVQPRAIRSSSPVRMPVFTAYIPPSRPMRMFLMPWATPATVSPTAARRSASRFSCSRRFTGVMSVHISMRKGMSPLGRVIGTMWTR